MRVSLVVFLLPFFGGKGLPVLVRGALCLVLTFALWPHLSFPYTEFPLSPVKLGIMAVGELFFGMILSLIIRCIFAGIQMAGQIIGFQMGFSMMNVVDPLSGTSVELTSQFLYLVTLLLFLTLDGHLYMLAAFAKSFQLVPPGTLLINQRVYDDVLFFSSQLFVIAIKVAAPVMVAELLVSCGLGIVARLAPQINVLFVGFPIKIAVGFFFMGILFDLIFYFLKGTIVDMSSIFRSIMVVK